MIVLTNKDIEYINHHMYLYGFCIMRYKGRTFDIVGIEETLNDYKSLRDKDILEKRIKFLEEIIKNEKLMNKNLNFKLKSI